MTNALDRGIRAFVLVLGIATLGLGLWAFADPRSFFDAVATFEPYNRHLLHDVGAFQAGLGVALIAAVRVQHPLGLALGAYAVAAVLHAISHVIDRDLGGRSTDPLALGLVAALVVGAFVTWTTRRTETPTETP